LVVSPDVGDEGFPATIERVSKFIQDRGGEVKDVDEWGRRRLAYPIRRFNEGFYAVFHFGFDPTEVRPLERNLDLAEDVLRHLVVKHEEGASTAGMSPPPPRRGSRFGQQDDRSTGDVPPPPRPGSRIGEEALEAAGEEPGATPEDSPLSPREGAIAEADEEESVVSAEEVAPVAEEAGLEPEEPESSVTTEPDEPSEPDGSSEKEE
jgi:small subunit ribosomal protein S6